MNLESITGIIPRNSMGKVIHMKQKGGSSRWRKFSEWLNAQNKKMLCMQLINLEVYQKIGGKMLNVE